MSTDIIDPMDIPAGRLLKERYRGTIGRETIILSISQLYRLMGKASTELPSILKLSINDAHVAADGVRWERIS